MNCSASYLRRASSSLKAAMASETRWKACVTLGSWLGPGGRVPISQIVPADFVVQHRPELCKAS